MQTNKTASAVIAAFDAAFDAEGIILWGLLVFALVASAGVAVALLVGA